MTGREAKIHEEEHFRINLEATSEGQCRRMTAVDEHTTHRLVRQGFLLFYYSMGRKRGRRRFTTWTRIHSNKDEFGCNNVRADAGPMPGPADQAEIYESMRVLSIQGFTLLLEIAN